MEINVSDVIERLHDLQMYSPTLARKLDHEDQLPEEAIAYLINRVEAAYDRAQKATVMNKGEAYVELGEWLTLSYRAYASRLLLADVPWAFRFPKAGSNTRH